MQSHEDFMAQRQGQLKDLPNYNEHQHKLASDEQKLKHQVEPLPVPEAVDEPVAAEQIAETTEAIEAVEAQPEASQ